MSWSLGESQALAIKAARGAGYSWGLAEEAGFALRWLCRLSLPGAEALAALLAVVDGHQMPNPDPNALQRVSGDALCPLTLGAALMDRNTQPGADSQLGPVISPVILVPFAAQLNAQGSFVLEWEGAGFEFAAGRIAFAGSPAALVVDQAICTLRAGELPEANALTVATRLPATAQADVDRLLGFAARTYAPATEQSRLAGAGAGTADND